MPFGLPSLPLVATRAIPIAGLLAALLVLLGGALSILHAQSSPSISIELSPAHSVPQNTAITGTVTLRSLDPSDYSSLIFRADTTKYGSSDDQRAGSACLGEDTNTDITIDVDASSEEFVLRVHKACAAHIVWPLRTRPYLIQGRQYGAGRQSRVGDEEHASSQ